MTHIEESWRNGEFEMIIPTYKIEDVPVQDRWHIDTQNEEDAAFEAMTEEEWQVYLDAQDPDERRARVEQLLNEVN